MANKQSLQRYEIGMIGLGVMRHNLVLNIADHGFPVMGYDQDPNQVEALRKDLADWNICGTDNIKDFIALLGPPRAVMMLVPAGGPVDLVIKALKNRKFPIEYARELCKQRQKLKIGLGGSRTDGASPYAMIVAPIPSSPPFLSPPS